MKRPKHDKRKYSILERLIIMFLAAIIPVYVLGMSIHSRGLEAIRNELSSSTRAQAAFYMDSLATEIEKIRILQYDCLNDEYLNMLAIRYPIMSDYEIVKSIQQLRLRLITIENSSRYIRDVRAHISSLGKVISAQTGVSAFSPEDFEALFVPEGETGAQIIRSGGRMMLSTLHEWEKQIHTPLYAIEVELEPSMLTQALSQFETYPNSGSFLVWTKGEESVLARSAGGLPFEPGQEGLRAFLSGAEKSRDYLTITAASPYLGMELWRIIPQSTVMAPLQVYYNWVWAFSLITGLVILAYLVFVVRAIHRPLAGLVQGFERIETGDFSVSVPAKGGGEFQYLCQRFNTMARRLENLINQNYRQRILMQRAEMKQLQAQINPHFLYNSLFMINTMARVGDERLIPFTQHLGEYFRFITRNGTDEIPLAEELTHTRNYAEIQHMRFSKRLHMTIGDCPEEYLSMRVPRLILQPLLENAFEHAVEKRVSDSMITLTFTPAASGLTITVEDNGADMTDEKLEELSACLRGDFKPVETTALINIQRRIQLDFSPGSGLTVDRSPLGGLRVTLTLDRRSVDVPVADRG